jgi:Phosphodiester glycosidase
MFWLARELHVPTASAAQPQAPPRQALAAAVERFTLSLPDDVTTTVHLLRFDRATTSPRLIHMAKPARLLAHCRERGVAAALVGGFFVRPDVTPLGELRIDGRPVSHRPFAEPWNELRACVHCSNGSTQVVYRDEMVRHPRGDLLQAGPMLVRDGRSVIEGPADPEGFSATAHEFDSDITVGRYPRAALGISRRWLVAVACDGRSDADAGLTLGELAELMLTLGCERAINLDGGGSTSLVWQGRLLNTPREEHGAPLLGGRPVPTALAFEPR